MHGRMPRDGQCLKSPPPPVSRSRRTISARRYHGTLPALIAILSLVLSIAVVLTAVTMSAARAAQLF